MATTLTPTRSTSAGNPRDSFSLLRKEMDDLISNFWGNSQSNWLSQSMSPPLDVVESENSFMIKMDAPGLQAKDINVHVHGNTLTLDIERTVGRDL